MRKSKNKKKKENKTVFSVRPVPSGPSVLSRPARPKNPLAVFKGFWRFFGGRASYFFSRCFFQNFWPLDAGLVDFWPEHQIPRQKLHVFTSGNVQNHRNWSTNCEIFYFIHIFLNRVMGSIKCLVLQCSQYTLLFSSQKFWDKKWDSGFRFFLDLSLNRFVCSSISLAKA